MPAYLLLILNNDKTKMKLNVKNMMLTTLAKGGTPSGQICPNNTIELNIKTRIKVIFLCFDIVMFLGCCFLPLLTLCPSKYVKLPLLKAISFTFEDAQASAGYIFLGGRKY